MELRNSSSNLSIAGIESTAKQDESAFCPPYPSFHFDTLNTTVPYMFNAAVNVPLAILAIFANGLVLVALRHSSSICLPSKLFLSGLILTDLAVGLAVQPQFVVFLLTKAHDATATTCFFARSYGFVASMLSCVSLFTITGISLDRHMALFCYLKYREIVTARRVSAILVFSWSFAVFYASTWLWKQVLWRFVTYISIVICLLVISVAQIKIYRRLRRQLSHQVQDQTQLKAQQKMGKLLNLLKYKRTASNTLWIYGLFLLCYSPYLMTFFLIRFAGPSLLFQCVHEVCLTLVHLNSCLNPFVYCFRLTEIRNEVLKILQKCLGQRSQQ